MSKIKDILLEEIRFQKSGKDYKIPIPPKKIREGHIHPDGYYQITLRLREKSDVIYEDLIFPSELQKLGDYYKIAVPRNYLKHKLLVLNGEYDVILHLLHLPLEDGVYIIKGGKITKSAKEIDTKEIEQVF